MQMPAHEVWDIVSNMKQLVEKEPDKAKQMFVSHPQVMMIMMMGVSSALTFTWCLKYQQFGIHRRLFFSFDRQLLSLLNIMGSTRG